MKSQVLLTVWCISGEAAGEIWSLSLLGEKGLSEIHTHKATSVVCNFGLRMILDLENYLFQGYEGNRAPLSLFLTKRRCLENYEGSLPNFIMMKCPYHIPLWLRE